VCCLSLLSFREFLLSAIRLPIALGFLVHYSHAVHPLWFGEFLFQMPLKSLVHDLHAVRPPITWRVFIPISLKCLVHGSGTVHPLSLGEFLGPILLESLVYTVHPLLLGECLVQYHWNVLYAVCALFIPYCLENFLVQCYWIALCTIRALFILYFFGGNSCSHFILERLCFLCTPFFCHFSLRPSAPFPSECLLCVSLALSSLALLCRLPVQLGHLPSTSFVSMTYRNPYWSILFLVLQLLPFAF